MNICHLYRNTSTSTLIQEILPRLKGSESFALDTLESLKEYDAYVVEIEKLDENTKTRVLRFLQSEPPKLLYFLVGNTCDLSILKLALELKAKSLITSSQDPKAVLSQIQEDYQSFQMSDLKYKLGKASFESLLFLFFKDKELFYVSEKLLQEFGYENILDVKGKLLPQTALDELLDKNVVSEKTIVNEKTPTLAYHARSVATTENNETIIFLDPFKKETHLIDKMSFISNRLSFIEFLKDRLAQSSVSASRLSLITLHIENAAKLRENLTELELEEIIKDFLLQVEMLLDGKVAFSQYNQNFYVVMFENIEFDALKKKANQFNVEISSYLNKQKYVPLLGIFAFDLNNQPLNFALTMLEKLVRRELKQEDVKGTNIEFITNIQENMDEKGIIFNLLESVFTNGSDIKLLNFYKGLCINTSAKIIKIKNEDVYVQFEHLQGLVMKVEGQTVLQSSRFSKDIQATIKHLSLDKKIAMLTNFKMLETSANARKYSRVTTSSKTLVVLSYKGATLNGEVFDISVTSIAMDVIYAKLFDLIEDQTVQLTFILPSHSATEGFIRIKTDARVVYQSCQEKICKIVCEFVKDESLESILMEYVYNRQKEIITELKMISKNSAL